MRRGDRRLDGFLRLGLRRSGWSDEPVILGQELKELVSSRLREVDDLHAPGMPVPEPLEGFDLVLNVLEVASTLPR